MGLEFALVIQRARQSRWPEAIRLSSDRPVPNGKSDQALMRINSD